MQRFQFDRATLIQGSVQFPLIDMRERVAADWWDLFGRLIQNVWAIGSPSLAARIALQPNGTVERTLLVLTPQSDEFLLRRYLATFTRLETVVPGSISFPMTAAAYEAALPTFPNLRIAVRSAGYRSREAWFACGFRVASILDDLVSLARTRGYSFTYQINLNSIEPDADVIREARKNEWRVSQMAGVPAAAVSLQRDLVNALTSASAICEEYIGAATRETAKWLTAAMSRAFDQQFRSAHFDVPAFEILEGAFEDSLATGVHTARLGRNVGVQELVEGAVIDSDVPALMGWLPRSATFALLRSVAKARTTEIVEGAVPDGVLPAPCAQFEKYLFVSYAHVDALRIAPVLEAIQKLGYRFWYDRQIPGASEWLALIEERLESSTAILLFLSNGAVESRFLRKEVMYADAIKKEILPIELESAELKHGLSLLLTPYQRIENPGTPAGFDALRRALASLFSNTL